MEAVRKEDLSILSLSFTVDGSITTLTGASPSFSACASYKDRFGNLRIASISMVPSSVKMSCGLIWASSGMQAAWKHLCEWEVSERIRQSNVSCVYTVIDGGLSPSGQRRRNGRPL